MGGLLKLSKSLRSPKHQLVIILRSKAVRFLRQRCILSEPVTTWMPDEGFMLSSVTDGAGKAAEVWYHLQLAAL